MRTFSSRMTFYTIPAAVMALGLACWQPLAHATGDGTPVTYSGDAQVVDVDLILLKNSQLETPITVDLVKVGPLPASGGVLHEHLLFIGDPAAEQILLTAEVAHAFTSGSGFEAFSQAHVAEVDLGLGPAQPDALRITATLLQANSKAVCKREGGVELSGSSTIVNLVINDQQQAISGMPNQTITIPNVATVIINEQTSSSTATSGDITVNALHVQLTPPPSPLQNALTGDVIISHAHSDINNCPPAEPPCPDPNNPECPPVCPGDVRCPCPNPLRTDCPTCSAKDFVTGGGYVLKDGNKVSFSTHGGTKNDGSLFGGFNVVDHNPGGPHIKDSGPDSLSSYTDPAAPSTTRVLQFFCDAGNGVCTITVADNGEPGNAPKGTDTWHLATAGYSAGSTTTPIEGGNIQLHRPRGCEVQTFGSSGGGGKGGGKGGGGKGGGKKK